MAYATEGAASTKDRESLLSELDGRLSATREALEQISERIGRVVGRALGDQPPSVGKEHPRPVRSGSIGVMQDRMDDIGAKLADLQALAARLETLA